MHGCFAVADRSFPAFESVADTALDFRTVVCPPRQIELELEQLTQLGRPREKRFNRIVGPGMGIE